VQITSPFHLITNQGQWIKRYKTLLFCLPLFFLATFLLSFSPFFLFLKFSGAANQVVINHIKYCHQRHHAPQVGIVGVNLLSLPSLFLPLSSLITLVDVTLWTIVDGMKKKILFYSNNSCSIKKKILCVKIILNKSYYDTIFRNRAQKKKTNLI
jgi:hypothetical protein